MTNRNFTDEEIIKALKCCSSYDCDGCPLYSPTINCVIELPKKALELVERQRAEIERLRKYNTDVAFKHYNDGIKEFAERLKKRTRMPLGTLYGEMVYLKDIDTLVKEMTEEKKL